MMKDTINFLLAGVGGQGTILASDVLVNAGVAAGLQAKQAEVHGMSQRGGSVVSHVRWGKVVYSPIVGAGEVDVYVAFEKLEAVRHLSELRSGALAIINEEVIMPVTAVTGAVSYPEEARLKSSMAVVTQAAMYLDAGKIAEGLGNVRVANVVMLGTLAHMLDEKGWAGPGLSHAVWLKVIGERVPAKYLELNKQAFQVGWDQIP
jgi:indolepyruvate ferredoxin oxidoreductase, beta subunit